MIKVITKLLKSIRDIEVSKALLSFEFEGYLYEVGWPNAFKSRMPVDGQNQPIPWVTYPFIDFIAPRLNNNLTLFEFGSGNSTLFYARLVKEVFSVENDKNWYERIENTLPPNAQLFFVEMTPGGEYCHYAAKPSTAFDIIIVDGRDRVNCCINSIVNLSQEGVLILDDSERVEYTPARDFLIGNSFKELPFWGMAPGLKVRKCTSVFYRQNNCLGI